MTNTISFTATADGFDSIEEGTLIVTTSADEVQLAFETPHDNGTWHSAFLFSLDDLLNLEAQGTWISGLDRGSRDTLTIESAIDLTIRGDAVVLGFEDGDYYVDNREWLALISSLSL